MSAPIPRDVTLQALVADWSKIAGPLIASTTWPLLLTQDGCLAVATASVFFTSELRKREPELLRRLPTVDGNTIRSIRWTAQPPTEPRRIGDYRKART